MKYEQARELVQDGDFVFFKAQSFKQRIICFITGGEHSHCGIANWLTDDLGNRRLMLIESFVGGCRMVTMSSYSNRDCDILTIADMDWASSNKYVMSKVGEVKYGMFDFVTIGVKDIAVRLGVRSRMKWMPDSGGQVCSEMLADVLSQFKSVTSTLVSPATLFKELHDRQYVVRKLSVR